LREWVVEIGITAVDDLTAKRLADGTWVGVMPIGRHPFRDVTNHLGGLLEKALGRLPVSLLAQH